MRCCIYCRISLDATGEELGVTRQLEDCAALAKSLGWPVVEIYTDNDISASSGKVRPAYRAMLNAIKAGEIEAVIAWHPDRLYRKLRDLEELIEVAEQQRITIRTVRAGEFDLGTPTGKMLARILASVSAGEGDIKSDRWKRSVRQRRERGDQPGMGPRLFGYNRDGTVNEAEAEHVRALVDDILDGVPIIRATHRLNERGARTTLDNLWSRPSVAKYLRNGRIAGRSTLNGDTVGHGTWPAIVDEETFEQVQTILDARRGTVPQRPRVALLLGIIYCDLCGSRLVTGGRAARGNGTKVRTYRCSTMPASGGCGRVSILAEPVEDVAEAAARAAARDPRVLARVQELAATATAANSEAVELEQRLTELEEQLDTPGVPVPAILRAMDRTRQRLDEIRSLPQVAPVADLRGDWPTDLARRARLIRSVIERIDIRPSAGGRGVFDPERIRVTPH
jgi:DNA invertase Pin-like site-specific DNA recombinase